MGNFNIYFRKMNKIFVIYCKFSQNSDVAIINKGDGIVSLKTETNNIEFKKAKDGVSEKLYDIFSSFSNIARGIVIFGVGVD